MLNLIHGSTLGVLMLSACLSANAVEPSLADQKLLYSAPVRENITNLYWGDLHLHSKLSADAYILQTRLTSDQAFQFARGETVKADNGMPAKLRRPLDFLAVTDHAEYLGIYAQLALDDPRLNGWKMGMEWKELMRQGDMGTLARAFSDAIQTDEPEYLTPESLRSSIWEEASAVADKYNEPGVIYRLCWLRMDLNDHW